MSTIPMSVTTPVPTTVRDSRAQPAPTVELLDRFLTRPMFFLAFGFLLLSAGLIHRMGHDDQTPFEHAVILWGLVGLWPVFVCEGMLRLVVCRRPGTGGWQRLAIFLAVCLFPPFRLGGRAYANPEQLWLPGLGWNTVGSHLQARLERLFCVPMVITALLVLPLLALEYFWLEAVRAHFGLSLLLDIGTSVIWLAFATELIVMVSLADNKARYCWQNWMDVAVVFLPLVDFLPLLRLVRLIGFLEVQQLSRLGRLYRLRGLLSKIWRTILLLEVIQHLLGNYRERRLQRLKELLATRRQEIDELHKEIADLENLLAGQKMPADESVAGRTDLDER